MSLGWWWGGALGRPSSQSCSCCRGAWVTSAPAPLLAAVQGVLGLPPPPGKDSAFPSGDGEESQAQPLDSHVAGSPKGRGESAGLGRASVLLCPEPTRGVQMR